MTERADDESHPISAPQMATWLSHLRYIMAMALISLGVILTVVWSLFLGWVAIKTLYFW